MDSTRTAYLAFDGYVEELKYELKNVESIHERLFICTGPEVRPIWAQQIWSEAKITEIESIKQAVTKLKENGKLWALYSVTNHRRANLIQKQLAEIKNKKIDFLGSLPKAHIGSWSLINNNQMILSANTHSIFPLGEIHFNEDHENPPSRAYLKLWEVMTIHHILPQKNQRVVDFGSSPGGWTWVLQSLGCQVISIDKANLAPHIANLPRIEFIKKNAFTLKPQDIGPIDWFFSDIICYPEKLYELIGEWIQSGLCQNFVCTIKFQGKTDFKALAQFAKLPGAHLVHLFHNKHEITLILKLK